MYSHTSRQGSGCQELPGLQRSERQGVWLWSFAAFECRWSELNACKTRTQLFILIYLVSHSLTHSFFHSYCSSTTRSTAMWSCQFAGWRQVTHLLLAFLATLIFPPKKLILLRRNALLRQELGYDWHVGVWGDHVGSGEFLSRSSVLLSKKLKPAKQTRKQ